MNPPQFGRNFSAWKTGGEGLSEEGREIDESGDAQDVEKTTEDIGHHDLDLSGLYDPAGCRNKIRPEAQGAKGMPSGFPGAAIRVASGVRINTFLVKET